jgi:hypothetical protein
MGPHPGIAIGLELERHRKAVRIRATRSLLRLPYSPRGTDQVLDVVGDLVANHVGGGEVTRPTEAGELVEEREIEVDLVIESAGQ